MRSAVRLGTGQHPRVGAGGDEHDVGLDLLLHPAVEVADLHPVRDEPTDLVREPGLAADAPHADALQPGVDVGGLGDGQAADALVDRGDVQADVGQVGALQAEDGGVAHRGHRPGGGDEGLGGHAVGQHAGPAEAVPLDDGDVGAELGGDERGLVAGRSAPMITMRVMWRAPVRCCAVGVRPHPPLWPPRGGWTHPPRAGRSGRRPARTADCGPVRCRIGGGAVTGGSG